jgi:beta-glucanase (GH16 family)
VNRHLRIAIFVWLVAPAVFGQQANHEEGLPSAPDGKQWKFVWHDEFDGSALDESKWETHPEGRRRDAWWMREAVSLDGKGHLVIRTFKQGDRYIDGCARTRGKFEHAFGYHVARIKLQKQSGHWPAFWLFNMTEGKIGNQGRDGSEIDIMEKPWLDGRVNHAIHWNGYGTEHRSAGKVARAPNLMQGFHTYSLFWSATEYVFYIDGKETWRTNAGGVCQVPLYIKLSDEVGDWAGDIKKVKLPDEFLVDCVRVYNLVERR